MTECPATVGPDDRLIDVRKLFATKGVHHVPVLADGKLVGMLSASDFLKLHLLARETASLADTQVRDIMRANPIVIQSDASLRDAAEKLRPGKFHALPVVNADGSIVGIVTTTDLIEMLLQRLPQGDGSVREGATDLRSLVERNRLLEAACRAAELYIRSGHADREHTVLVKRLAELRAADTPNL